jgi:hypothetical protein
LGGSVKGDGKDEGDGWAVALLVVLIIDSVALL